MEKFIDWLVARVKWLTREMIVIWLGFIIVTWPMFLLDQGVDEHRAHLVNQRLDSLYSAVVDTLSTIDLSVLRRVTELDARVSHLDAQVEMLADSLLDRDPAGHHR